MPTHLLNILHVQLHHVVCQSQHFLSTSFLRRTSNQIICPDFLIVISSGGHITQHSVSLSQLYTKIKQQKFSDKLLNIASTL